MGKGIHQLGTCEWIPLSVLRTAGHDIDRINEKPAGLNRRVSHFLKV
jgi:hypothetical protein